MNECFLVDFVASCYMFKFCWKVPGKVEMAREILDQAVENIQLSKPILEVLSLSFHPPSSAKNSSIE